MVGSLTSLMQPSYKERNKTDTVACRLRKGEEGKRLIDDVCRLVSGVERQGRRCRACIQQQAQRISCGRGILARNASNFGAEEPMGK